MTTIVYTITLRNSSGIEACATSTVLEYPDTPAGKLKSEAVRGVADLERTHRAVLDLLAADEEALQPMPMKAMGVAVGK